MSEALDLGQLQAQLELKRSALADSILAKLPGFGAASASEPTKQAPAATTSRPRQANLGVGATPKSSEASPANGKPNSAVDLRLKGALTAKRKRWQDEPVARGSDGSESDPDDVGRADAITSKKSKQQPSSAASATKASAPAKTAKKDPFATKGIDAQRAAQNQPRIVVLDGEEIDLSKLSKTQRKKINKQLKAQEQSQITSQGSEESEHQSQTSASPPKAIDSQSASTPNAAAKKAEKSTASPAGGALTALQAQMLSKLSGSRFRTINEKLYTTASDEAVRMIDAAPVMFDEYHQGFREQVRTWPKNPLDRIVDMFDPTNAAANAKGKAKAKGNAAAAVSKSAQNRARFTPGALVVDLGAGEGGLAKKLVPRGVKVLCYDLVTTKDGWVRKQDTAAIGGLPLPGFFDPEDPLGLQVPPQHVAPGLADVAVFCLSLMGTNWIHMILEAKRVLRVGGELIVAEVSSRFDGFDAFVSMVKMLGFRLDHKDASNTHFVLFEFTRLDHAAHAAALSKSADDAVLDPHTATLDELASAGKQLLKPCIYKRR